MSNGTVFGVTDQGFVLKRLSDILSDLAAALSTIQDPQTGETLYPNLANENDPLAQVVNALSDGLSEAWEELQECYNQFDPLKATGAGQDGTYQLNGIEREPGVYSQALCALSQGPPNLAVNAGIQVAVTDQSIIFVLPAFSFDGNGNASVIGIATVEGVLASGASTVTLILTPIPGAASAIVTNPQSVVAGYPPETDTAFRARQQVSTSATASSIVESIYGGLLNLLGVSFCRIYQNITLVADSRGLPAKSIAVVIVGGDDTEIATLIFQRNPLSLTYGSTTVNISDLQFFVYPISFSRPAPLTVRVIVNVAIVNSNLWPSNGAALIQAAILEFAQNGAAALGLTVDINATNGYSPGQSVYASDLYVPVMSVPGIKITSIKVDTANPPVADEVDPAWNQIVAFSTANITVNVTG